jgi:hypothetical protein
MSRTDPGPKTLPSCYHVRVMDGLSAEDSPICHSKQVIRLPISSFALIRP